MATDSLLLIQHGFLTSEELQNLGEGLKRGDLIKNLVNESMISPHSVTAIRTEQTLADIQRLFLTRKMNFNLVPEDVKERGANVDIEKLTPLIHEALQTVLTAEFLDDFYEDWMDYPIQLGPQFSKNHPVFSLSIL